MKDIEYPTSLDLDVYTIEDENDFGVLIEVQTDGSVQWTTIEGQVWDDKPSKMDEDDGPDLEDAQ